eukprot:TRINITY_DN4134_c0_g1_i6.p2 TRINITY_DN4134_c0_g1~~TRINITY_DN4134_c0_g1_i6.p2  ORF type:complete len:192 (+),score=19.65 TRINITY_DN4134_c0_g1_i6:503-1078(+)
MHLVGLAVTIVRLLDDFTEGKSSCLVLEPLAKTLYQLAADQGYSGFPLCVVKSFAWQLLVGLAELSLNEAIIHADLKPDNIMIKKILHKKIKIIDFGSSLYSNSRKAKYVQSRFYRAPEVILGCSYTPAVDMWSVGCILCELHTGKPLFNGRNEGEQLVLFTQKRLGQVYADSWSDTTKAYQKWYQVSQVL